MNKFYKIIPFFLLFIFISCEKDGFDLFRNYKNGLPEVKTVSVEMINDDTAEMIGEVIYTGKSTMMYTGFCISSDPVPEMLDNQILLNGTEGKFNAIVFGLEPTYIYYFRTFAANEFGYAYGNIIRFEVPYPDPPHVPCILADNVITSNGSDYNVSSASSGLPPGYGGVEKITISCFYSGGPSIDIEFMRMPINGIYTTSTVGSFTLNNKNVFVSLHSGYYINPGGKVYVSIDNNGKMTVSFCDLKYKPYSTELTIKGKAIFN